MPPTIGPFHSFAPLDDATRDTTITFFGFHSPVFRARHQGDGQLWEYFCCLEGEFFLVFVCLFVCLFVSFFFFFFFLNLQRRYALRALKSFRPTAANVSLERWRDVRHPAIVALQQAFWTDQVAVRKKEKAMDISSSVFCRSCKCGLCTNFILGLKHWKWLIWFPQTPHRLTRMCCGATFANWSLLCVSFMLKDLLADVFIRPRFCSLERQDQNFVRSDFFDNLI